MDGILNIDKPWGKTSFSVVARVKRLTGERRVGHAGTLDPTATGVLPVCLGQGTRIIEFLLDATKAYRAQIELGVATDTHDTSGKITSRGDTSVIDRSQLESALAAFRGLIQQVPPMYSAVKYRGKRLYELAREGIEVERKSRPTRIHKLELVDWQPPVVTVDVVCDKGTYIRSLAHDLGQLLGCGGHLKSLVRTRCGFFDIKDSTLMSQLEDAFKYGYWEQFIHPTDTALRHFRAIVVGDITEENIRKGCPVSLDQIGDLIENRHSDNKYCRAYTSDGRFLGVLHSTRDKSVWQPKKVFL